MTNQELSQKFVVITGGSRGIGAGIARKLAALGATVIICGRNRASLEQTCAQIRSSGAQCEAMACDVADGNSLLPSPHASSKPLGGWMCS